MSTRLAYPNIFQKRSPKILLIFLFMLCLDRSKASEIPVTFITESDTVQLMVKEMNGQRPNPILQMFKKRRDRNKRITAAILAFPFPFGIVGLHRIYMGTAPHVPVVYIGTLGGIFGILPFIDFCVIVLDKDIDRYMENPKIFMWVN